jgi:predicted MFS family arabinose efflux permease
MVLYGIAHGTRAVSEWALLGDVVMRDDRSLSNFYFATVFDLGSAFGATFAGFIAMVISPPTIFIIAALLMGSSVLVVAFSKIQYKRE